MYSVFILPPLFFYKFILAQILFYITNFVANRFMMKPFNTNNMQIIEFCCEQFNYIIPSRQIANRRDKFVKSDSQRNNLLTFINM